MAGNADDLLDPSEIEALLKSAGALGRPGPLPSDAPSSPPAPAPAPGGLSTGTPSGDGGVLSAGEIATLLQKQSGAGQNPLGSPGPDELLGRAQQGVAAALDMPPRSPSPAARPVPPRAPKPPADPRLSQARPYAFETLDDPTANADPQSLAALEEVELDLRIELGRAELLIEEVLKLREGAVVPLDKLAGDPVDILVNGRLVARGEVLVLNDNFCVRVAEILAPPDP